MANRERKAENGYQPEDDDGSETHSGRAIPADRVASLVEVVEHGKDKEVAVGDPHMVRLARVTEARGRLKLRRVDEVRVRSLPGNEPGAQQQFGDEVDVNTIVRRFGVEAFQPLAALPPELFGDFTDIHDFESARDRVRAAQEAFLQLPPEAREELNNDPARLVEMAQSMGEDALREALGLPSRDVVAEAVAAAAAGVPVGEVSAPAPAAAAPVASGSSS